ncbi:hypothetical protein [Blastococcus sp. SYSU D00820]
MTNTNEAVLTDDEIAALCRRLGGRWRSVWPTIDPDDATDLGRAVFRGDRSLLARGLLESSADGTLAVDTSLEDMARTALDGELRVSAFTADRELTFEPTGFTYLNYARPGSGDVLVEVVSAVGLHRFGLLTGEQSTRALVALVSSISEGTPTPEVGEVSDTFVLTLPAATPSQRLVFAVRAGTVERAVITPAELTEVDRTTVPLEPSTLDDLLTMIGEVYGEAVPR